MNELSSVFYPDNYYPVLSQVNASCIDNRSFFFLPLAEPQERLCVVLCCNWIFKYRQLQAIVHYSLLFILNVMQNEVEFSAKQFFFLEVKKKNNKNKTASTPILLLQFHNMV